MEPALSTLFSRPVLALIVSPIVLLTGCSDGDDSERGPYYDEVVAASRSAESAFERDVLADGELTRAEYEEAVQRYVSCAADRGVEITPVRQGSRYAYQMSTDPESDRVALRCSVGTTRTIEALYGDIVANPTNGDYEQLVVRCLIRSGLAPQGYTKARFLDEREGDLPFPSDDPRLQECLENVEAY